MSVLEAIRSAKAPLVVAAAAEAAEAAAELLHPELVSLRAPVGIGAARLSGFPNVAGASEEISLAVSDR